jgi:hypothetical protein
MSGGTGATSPLDSHVDDTECRAAVPAGPSLPGTGQLAKAAQTVDAVRTTVGGIASGLGGVNTSSYWSVRDFLMREMLPSLMDDGTGDQITAIRDYGLIMQDPTTWGAKAFHTSMLPRPALAREQRNNNFAAVCP